MIKSLNQIFLIIKSSLDIKSYYFKENKKYHTYKFLPLDKNNFIIEEFNDATKILASISEIILVFDFHSGDLLELIKIDNGNFINCLCFWNQFYLFAGCYCRNLQLIDYSCKKKVKEFNQSCVNDLKKNKASKIWRMLYSFA